MAEPRRLAVITGGSRGIGRAFVLEAAQRGYDVVFSYRSREADAAKTVELAAALGGQANSVCADLENLEGVHTLASVAHAKGEVSLLVNNAGIGEEFTLEELTREAWERSVAINLTAPTFLAKEFKADLMGRDPQRQQRRWCGGLSAWGCVRSDQGRSHRADQDLGPRAGSSRSLQRDRPRPGGDRDVVRDRSRGAAAGDGARDAAEAHRTTGRHRSRGP